MNNFKMEITTGNSTKTIIVRSKTNVECILGKNSFLDEMGLEQVPYQEIIPKFKKIKGSDKLLDTDCPICHESFKLNEFQRTLTCNHVFHKKCIDKWLKDNLNCPMCRKEIDI